VVILSIPLALLIFGFADFYYHINTLIRNIQFYTTTKELNDKVKAFQEHPQQETYP
jgi:hypothetical protein